MFQALIGPIGGIVSTWLEGSVAKAKAKARVSVAKAEAEEIKKKFEESGAKIELK